MSRQSSAARSSPRRLALAAAVALAFVPTSGAYAADFVVANEAALRNAILAAGNTDTITFGGNITLTGDLPAVQSNVTIRGQNFSLSGNNQFRGLFVGAWTPVTADQVAVAVTVQDLTIHNTRAQGGAGGLGSGGGGAGLGGALFVANFASVTVSNVRLTGSNATGGKGGSAELGAVTNGGGGGMGGNGGGNGGGGGGGLGAGAHGGGFLQPGLDGIATGALRGGATSLSTQGGANGGGGGGEAFGTSAGGGGVGGFSGGGGGGSFGGSGQFGGGGGGGVGSGGEGGFGGGGGSGPPNGGSGGPGGFGGGGGSAGGVAGLGGFGGGAASANAGGGTSGGGGGGGAGMGGAVFVQEGGSLVFAGALSIDGNTVAPGIGGTALVSGPGGGSGAALGAGIFLQGNGTLTFAPGAGQAHFVENGIADQTGSGGTGPNAGSWALTHSGAGTLVLAGVNTYTGATTVNAGALVVNGSLMSPVTVNSGATLAGSGTVNNTVSLMGGAMLAPGNSIGTLTVSGNVSFAAGSIYQVEVDAAGNGDRLNVTGAATISGGTVQVLAGAGTYQSNTQYTILSATAGVAGTFTAVTSNLAFLTPSLSYSGNDVLLMLMRNTIAFGEVGATQNQHAVGTYLDAVAGEPGVQALITSVTNLSDAQAKAAYSSLSGQGLTAPARVAIINSAGFIDLLTDRIGAGTARLASGPIQLASLNTPLAQLAPSGVGEPKRGEDRGVWLRVRGLRGDVDGNENASGFDFEGGGLAGGFDTAVGRDSKLGIAYSYMRDNTTLQSDGGKSLTRSSQLAVYGLHETGRLQLKGVLGAGRHDIESNRNVTIGASTTAASSDHGANEWSAYAEANYTLKLGGYEVKPIAGLRYIRLQESGYTEQGSAASLTVDERTTESVTPLMGVRLLRPFNVERGRFELRAIYSYEAGDADPAISGRLAAAPAGGTFTAHGAPIGRSALTLGMGIENEVATRLSLFGDYNVELREGQTVHALVAGVRYAW